MASQKISQFTAITTLASGDYFPVIQASGTTNKRVDVGVLDQRYTLSASGIAAQDTANQALSSGNAAQVTADTALASGNAALSDLLNKYDKVGGPISGPAFTQSQTFGVPSGIVTSGVIILDLGQRDNFEVTLGGNSTLGRPLNASGGQCGAIIVRQDSGGSRLLSYSGGWGFVGNSAPTLTTGASGVDMLGYYVVNPSRINIVANLNYSSGTVS
jgi:hypothetical protein